MTKNEIHDYAEMALNVREHVIKLTALNGCFIGASLSCADLLVYLYSSVLNITDFKALDRDYFFLSKGHDVPALYGVFAELGILDADRLKSHLSVTDHIYWHPNRNIKGVEFHSGSLGHLPSVAIGVALDQKLSKLKSRVFVMLGDGEMNEGTIWEAMLVASAKKLDNLVFLIDCNKFQANMKTEDLIPLEPMMDKFLAFGFDTIRADGHSFADIEKAFNSLSFDNRKPSAIIFDTVRGMGLPSIEARVDRWFCEFTEDEVKELLIELRGGHSANVTSDTLVVR